MGMEEMRAHPRIENRTSLSEPVIYDRALLSRIEEILAKLGSEADPSLLDAFSSIKGDDLKTWGRVTGYFDLEQGYYSDFQGIHVFVGCTGGSESPIGMEFRKAFIIAAVAYDDSNKVRLNAPEILYEIQYGETPRRILRTLAEAKG